MSRGGRGILMTNLSMEDVNGQTTDCLTMKSSGTSWLGDIPGNWDFPRIHSLFYEVNDRYSPHEDKEWPLLSVSEYYGVAPRAEKIDEDAILVRAETLDGYKKCQPGDIVVNIMLAWKNALGVVPCAGIVSPAYCVYRARKGIEPRYYHHLFRTKRYGDVFRMASTGIIDSRLRLYTDKFFSIHAPLPPLPEQRAIADFLDEKCATIDAIVEEAKAGIAEYAEWKRSIIFHAVTKGIPEDGRAAVPGRRAARGDARPPRDSGEKWIGQIPAHWSVLPLKTHADMLTPMRDRPEHLDGPIPWVRIEDFDGKYISASKDGLGVSESTVQEMNLKVYPVGTVLCTSSCDLGKCAIVATPLVSNQRFIGIIPKPGLLADFLYYLMLSNAERLNMLSTGTIQANLSRVEFERLRVQIPPLPEQHAIAAWLDEKCAAIDALVEEKKKLIEDLGAYKKSLIYETVTGKRRIPK